jgi:hypothetical protein
LEEEVIAIDGTKAELTIARKPISIKENRQTLSYIEAKTQEYLMN